MKCIYRQCIDVDHWDICTCAIHFWKYIWCWPWVCLDGPLGNANLERKLNVKVRIKVVSIFSNCLEQRSMSFGHARDTQYFLQKNEASWWNWKTHICIFGRSISFCYLTNVAFMLKQAYIPEGQEICNLLYAAKDSQWGLLWVFPWFS